MSWANAELGSARARWTLALCGLAALTEGFDIQSMGVAAPGIAPALKITRDQLGPVFSASLLGLLIGAVVFGRVADRVGRKWVLIGSMAFFGLFSVATAFAWDFDSLLWIRVLAGIGLGGALPILLSLSAEAVSVGLRVRLVALAASAMPFGGAIAGGVAAAAGWRDIFFIGGVAPLVLAPVMIFLLPESLSFVAARRRHVEAKAPAIKLVSTLFGPARWLTTLLLWLASVAVVMTLYLLLNWLPTLMGAKGVGKAEASVISVLFNIGGGLGVLVLGDLLSRKRKTLTVALWFAGLAIALVALALASADLAAAGGAGFAAGVFIVSGSIILYSLAPSHYPAVERGAGVGASIAAGRLGAIAGPLLAAALLSAGAGPTGVLLTLVPIEIVAAFALLGLLSRPVVAE
ncbi:MAG TPA: MFS transporter [Caulobacteraceae bacterium]|jgi:AAHS family 3-hydroxyphenylpropionic acid transporter|nr:MFS transporter [Caulobacteraceae bacterium]